MATIILFNKPFRVLPQFTDSEGRRTLAEFVDRAGFYAAGRLDYDSEGLLLLTNDGRLQQRIADPAFKLEKRYWVQVDGEITDSAIASLCAGVMLNDGMTRPAKAQPIPEPALWQREPPVRYRKLQPTSWLELTIREGRNRQVRRMTAAVGFPTLRLVRIAIGSWQLQGLQPGELRIESVFLPENKSPAPDRSAKGAKRRPEARRKRPPQR